MWERELIFLERELVYGERPGGLYLGRRRLVFGEEASYDVLYLGKRLLMLAD